MQRRKRLQDGTFGPLEDVFQKSFDETVLMMLEALAGQQEEIFQLREEIETLKGGKE